MTNVFTDHDGEVRGFLDHDYTVTGKVSALFIEEHSEACMFAVDDEDNS